MNEFAMHVKTNFGKELCAWQEEEKLKIPPNNPPNKDIFSKLPNKVFKPDFKWM